jgi:hypothetical protein
VTIKAMWLIGCGVIAACSSNKPEPRYAPAENTATPAVAQSPQVTTPPASTTPEGAGSAGANSAGTSGTTATPATPYNANPEEATAKPPAPMANPAQPSASTNSDDSRITQQIRKRLDDDVSLSSDAKNVTITTDKGVVTLEGQVKTESERTAIDKHARWVAGTNVKDRITITR